MSDMKTRKARKDHTCTFCGELIPKGSEYQDVTITPWCHIENESFGRWRTHNECMDFWNDGYGDGGDFIWHGECAEFREYMEEWKKQRLTTFRGD